MSGGHDGGQFTISAWSFALGIGSSFDIYYQPKPGMSRYVFYKYRGDLSPSAANGLADLIMNLDSVISKVGEPQDGGIHDSNDGNVKIAPNLFAEFDLGTVKFIRKIGASDSVITLKRGAESANSIAQLTRKLEEQLNALGRHSFDQM